jgi:hypothetical protein
MDRIIADNMIRYFELLAGTVGIICYYRNKQSIWFVFAVFLVCLFGMESLGHWFGTNKMYKQNSNLYNWGVIPLLFLVYHFCYYNIMIKKYKPFVIISYSLFVALTLYENIFWSGEHVYSISFTLSYGCITVLFFSLAYFYQLVNSETILHFKKLMPFWFCLGLLIFFLGSFPNLFFTNYFGKNNKTIMAITYRWVFIFLNYIMYLMFTIGYLWSKPK